MRQRAALASRSPPRLRRCRLVLPLWRGWVGPAQGSEGAFAVEPVGVVAGGHEQSRGDFRTDGFDRDQIRGDGLGDAPESGGDVLELHIKVLHPLGQFSQCQPEDGAQRVVVGADPERCACREQLGSPVCSTPRISRLGPVSAPRRASPAQPDPARPSTGRTPSGCGRCRVPSLTAAPRRSRPLRSRSCSVGCSLRFS